jgi:integrase
VVCKHVRDRRDALEAWHPCGKTAGSTRRVPLSDEALAALAMLPRGIGATLVFPSETGQLQHLENWRPRFWKPALEAPGVNHGTVYTLRHTAATNMLAAGISLFDVSRFLGTSAIQVSKTYGHLTEGAEDAARTKLNARANRSGV